MQNISVNFTTKRDEQFLLNNSQLTSEVFNRKYKYDEILVAKVDNQTVGLLVFDYLWYHIPFIAFIWVDSKYRKNGIGRALLYRLEKFFLKGKNDVLFSSSKENAKEAQAWHKHMGFKECGLISEINDDNTGEVFFRKSLKRNSQSIA